MNPRCPRKGCVREQGHLGGHLTEDDGLIGWEDYGGPKAFRCTMTKSQDNGVLVRCSREVGHAGAHDWPNGRKPIPEGGTKIPDPTNKPAFKRLLQKGAKQ